MKLLVLVGSSTVPPYDEFMKAQKETWAKVKNEHVNVWFYYAGKETKRIDFQTFTTECKQDAHYAHWRLKRALDFVWNWEWDLIFRCHSSSYVNVDLLYDFIKGFPTQGVYTGRKVGGEGLGLMEWRGAMIKQICVSGAGILMSRDVADILRKNLKEEEDTVEDDVLIGRLLQLHGIERQEMTVGRVDVESMKDYKLHYHYRFRTNDRQHDMDNMRLVHSIHTRL